MSAHTPGPWFWSRGIDDWELVGAGAERVLFCWSDKTKWKCGLVVGENIKQADARLIAAAPDMYAVLRELAECSEYWSEYDVPLGIHDRIATALAKAGGQ